MHGDTVQSAAAASHLLAGQPAIRGAAEITPRHPRGAVVQCSRKHRWPTTTRHPVAQPAAAAGKCSEFALGTAGLGARAVEARIARRAATTAAARAGAGGEAVVGASGACVPGSPRRTVAAAVAAL